MTTNQAWEKYEAAYKAYQSNPSERNADILGDAEENLEGCQMREEFDAANAGDFRD